MSTCMLGEVPARATQRRAVRWLQMYSKGGAGSKVVWRTRKTLYGRSQLAQVLLAGRVQNVVFACAQVCRTGSRRRPRTQTPAKKDPSSRLLPSLSANPRPRSNAQGREVRRLLNASASCCSAVARALEHVYLWLSSRCLPRLVPRMRTGQLEFHVAWIFDGSQHKYGQKNE